MKISNPGSVVYSKLDCELGLDVESKGCQVAVFIRYVKNSIGNNGVLPMDRADLPVSLQLLPSRRIQGMHTMARCHIKHPICDYRRSPGIRVLSNGR